MSHRSLTDVKNRNLNFPRQSKCCRMGGRSGISTGLCVAGSAVCSSVCHLYRWQQSTACWYDVTALLSDNAIVCVGTGCRESHFSLQRKLQIPSESDDEELQELLNSGNVLQAKIVTV